MSLKWFSHNDFVSWSLGSDIGSDHYPIKTTFSLHCNNSSQETFRNFKTADWTKFQIAINEVIPQLSTPKTADDLDLAVSMITKKIFEAFDHACPIQQRRHKTKTAFTEEMIGLVKAKRHLRRLKAGARRREDEQAVAALQREKIMT